MAATRRSRVFVNQCQFRRTLPPTKTPRQHWFRYTNGLLIGDGIGYYVARNLSNKPDPNIRRCPLLKENFPLDQLLNTIKRTKIPDKHVILSMGQYELNGKNYEYNYLRTVTHQIIVELHTQGVEKIYVLFPAIKPSTKRQPPVNIKKLTLFRRVFDKLNSENVYVIHQPAQVFAKMRENYETCTSEYITDKHDNVIVDRERFYWCRHFRRYYPDRSAYWRVKDAIQTAAQGIQAYEVECHITENVQQQRSEFFELGTIQNEVIHTPKTGNDSENLRQRSPNVDVTQNKNDSQPSLVQNYIANETRIINSMQNGNYDENVVMDSSIGHMVDETVSTQLRDQRENTCVVGLGVDDEIYAAQLDTGAEPNVMSKETARKLTANHPNRVKYIRLKQKVQVALADDEIVDTMSCIIVVELKFGIHDLKIPFYILPKCNQTFIVGRLTMEVLGIQPMLQEKVAHCKPSSSKEKSILPFLKKDEYKDTLTVQSILLPSTNDERMYEHIKKHTWGKNDEKYSDTMKDDSRERFTKKLWKNLEKLTKDGKITREEADYAYQSLENYSDVFSKTAGKFSAGKVSFKLQDQKKFRGRNYRPSNKLLPAFRKAIKQMLHEGIITPSDTEYINDVVVRVKNSGELRVCLNPKFLNSKLQNDYNEPATLDRIITDAHDAEFFSSLDFVSGFWQIMLDESSKKFTGFQVEGEVYQFERLPYGLKTSSAEFMKMINLIMPIKDSISKYVDDILVRNKSFIEQVHDLMEIFETIRRYGLKLNASKTDLFQTSAQHLGYMLKKGRVCKQEKKKEKFIEFKNKYTKNGKFTLKNEKEIQKLIGLVGLYAKFIPNFQQIVAPLQKLTRKNEQFKWQKEQTDAFEKLEEEYLKDFELSVPGPGDFYLETEILEDTINGVLYQKENDQDPKIVMFVSKTMQDYQKRYTCIDKEIYALTKCLKRLTMWIHGRTIHVRLKI